MRADERLPVPAVDQEQRRRRALPPQWREHREGPRLPSRAPRRCAAHSRRSRRPSRPRENSKGSRRTRCAAAPGARPPPANRRPSRKKSSPRPIGVSVQQLLEDLGHLPLDVVAGRFDLPRRVRLRRLHQRQRLAIDLAGCRLRQRVEEHESGRAHVGRNARRRMPADQQRIAILFVAGREIGDEPVGLEAARRRRPAPPPWSRRTRRERGLDLGQVHRMAAKLDSTASAAEEMQIALVIDVPEVAGEVAAPAGMLRVVRERGRVELGPAPVPGADVGLQTIISPASLRSAALPSSRRISTRIPRGNVPPGSSRRRRTRRSARSRAAR